MLSRRRPVLLADPSAAIRQRVAELLVESGCGPVIEAGRSDEALRLFVEHRPAAVLLDVELHAPGIVDLLRLMRAASPDALLIVLTSGDSDPYHFRCTEAGANHVVSRRCHLERLARMLTVEGEPSQQLSLGQ
jgi:DNA-binding NarL/FixJ family response regulator